MIRAVYDCNVILSGIGWNGSARTCLKFVARRRVFQYVTDAILAEYESVIPEVLAEEMPEIDPHPKLAWIRAKSRLIQPAMLGKRRSRAAKDDMYLACALAASAPYLVSYDGDLLALEKPFGIQTVRPAEFLRQIKDCQPQPVF
jgi:putative PIN family toxin of toxin-antitoxin system